MKLLSVDQLLSQMIQATENVTSMHKRLDNKQAIMGKLKEIPLIQKASVAREMN